jgi:DNA-binding response OmpR family regulator
MDGVEALRAMRETGNKTPVIMLTSESSTSVVDRVLGLGVSDYVLKPFKPDTLKEKVQQVLRSRTAG